MWFDLFHGGVALCQRHALPLSSGPHAADLNTFRGNGSNREVVLTDKSTEQGFSERAAALTPRPELNRSTC